MIAPLSHPMNHLLKYPPVDCQPKTEKLDGKEREEEKVNLRLFFCFNIYSLYFLFYYIIIHIIYFHLLEYKNVECSRNLSAFINFYGNVLPTVFIFRIPIALECSFVVKRFQREQNATIRQF